MHNKIIKEVIQPHVPVRLPCGDLAPLAKLKFDFPNYEESSFEFYSIGLTGGVCKEQGRIQRTIVTFAY